MWTKWTLSVLMLTLVTGVRPTVTMTRLVRASVDFSMRLYHNLVNIIDDENIFLSPFSVFTAMAMTYAGAGGVTAVEIRKTMNFEMYSHTGNALHDDFRDLLQQIKSSNNESRRYINKWAANATEQKVKNLLTPNDITPQTALVLANAMYFKAPWRTPFDKSKSTIHPFYVSADLTANIPMMQVTGKFRFRSDSALGCNFVELQYAGSRLSMILVIPRGNDGLPGVESRLHGRELASAVSDLKEVEITVKMPKFNMTQRFDLQQVLANMVIIDLFTRQADLSGLAEDSAGLYVSGVIHKAFISVNEEGTEAAAATGVVTSRARPLEVVADRPFMFVIWDQIGMPLFVGRFTQPTGKYETIDTSDNTPSAVERFEPVSLVTWLVSFAMLLFVGHAF